MERWGSGSDKRHQHGFFLIFRSFVPPPVANPAGKLPKSVRAGSLERRLVAQKRVSWADPWSWVSAGPGRAAALFSPALALPRGGGCCPAPPALGAGHPAPRLPALGRGAGSERLCAARLPPEEPGAPSAAGAELAANISLSVLGTSLGSGVWRLGRMWPAPARCGQAPRQDSCCSQVWARWGHKPSVCRIPRSVLPVGRAGGAAPARHFLAAGRQPQPVSTPRLGRRAVTPHRAPAAGASGRPVPLPLQRAGGLSHRHVPGSRCCPRWHPRGAGTVRASVPEPPRHPLPADPVLLAFSLYFGRVRSFS